MAACDFAHPAVRTCREGLVDPTTLVRSPMTTSITQTRTSWPMRKRAAGSTSSSGPTVSESSSASTWTLGRSGGHGGALKGVSMFWAHG